MIENMRKIAKLQLLLASVLLSACSEIVESSYEDQVLMKILSGQMMMARRV